MDMKWKINKDSQFIADLIVNIDGEVNCALTVQKGFDSYSTIPCVGYDFIYPMDISFEEIKNFLSKTFDHEIFEDQYPSMELAYVLQRVQKDFECQINNMFNA